jgi:hypothetical protein
LYGASTLSFFALDDVGCNGLESNLLDCLPQHNCKMDEIKRMLVYNAYVKVWTIKINLIKLLYHSKTYTFLPGHFRCQARVWIQSRKQ